MAAPTVHAQIVGSLPPRLRPRYRLKSPGCPTAVAPDGPALKRDMATHHTPAAGDHPASHCAELAELLVEHSTHPRQLDVPLQSLNLLPIRRHQGLWADVEVLHLQVEGQERRLVLDGDSTESERFVGRIGQGLLQRPVEPGAPVVLVLTDYR